MNPEIAAQDAPCTAFSARGLRVGIVTSVYHQSVCSALERGAVDAFTAAGGSPSDIVRVDAPGAFELVAISLAMAQRIDIDAVVALGCVLTGETSHDKFICEAVVNGLSQVSLQTGKPVAFGVLTCVTVEQARARSGGAKGNKGVEAMQAAIHAVHSIAHIRGEEGHVGSAGNAMRAHR